MTENEQSVPASPQGHTPAASDALVSNAFYDRAVQRMQRVMLVVGLAMVVVVLLRAGWVVALGAALGVVLAWHNFRWLCRAVDALGERITTGQSRERGGVVVFRFTVRILLIAAGAYVIFKYSQRGLWGYLVGLCAPVPALFCEALYEVFRAYRRGE